MNIGQSLVLEMSLDPIHLNTNTSDDFLDLGKNLTSPDFGPRYVKYSVMENDDYFRKGDIYIGEWSTTTDKPHGRGISIFNGKSIKFN
jgi:hypothetical protein